MKLTARGWSRDCGSHVLVSETDLAKADPVVDLKFWPNDRVAIDLDRDERGKTTSLTIGSKSFRRVTLSGDYVLQVRLTRGDLVHLFLATFVSEKLGKEVEMTHETRFRVVAWVGPGAQMSRTYEGTDTFDKIWRMGPSPPYEYMVLERGGEFYVTYRYAALLTGDAFVTMGDHTKYPTEGAAIMAAFLMSGWESP